MFFQNPFSEEFRGSLPFGDRQYSLDFICPTNTGREKVGVWSWKKGPYDFNNPTDLTGRDGNYLYLSFSFDFLHWNTMGIDINAALIAHDPAYNVAIATATDIAVVLNLNTNFNNLFTAIIGKFDDGSNRLLIRQNRPVTQFKFYIVNGYAEEAFQFNERAGLSELPEYFIRHTIANSLNYADSVGMLILLTPSIYAISATKAITVANPAVVTSAAHGLSNTNLIEIVKSDSNAVIDGTSLTVANVTANTFTCGKNVAVTAGTRGYWATMTSIGVISNAKDKQGNLLNYTFSNIKEDFELLAGRVGIFNFKNITIDATGVDAGLGRPLQIIEYPCGATAGFIAKKTNYVYSSTSDATPSKFMETPHVLKTIDLIEPF
jgi:hypothetical protein